MPNTTQTPNSTQRKAPPAQPQPKKNLFLEVLGILLSPDKHTVYRVRGGVDRIFLIIVVLLVCYGSIMVASASYVFANATMGGDSFYFIKKQLLWATIGIIAMIVMSVVDYGFLKKATPAIFAVSYFLLWLVFVPVIGVSNKGATRWVNLYVVQFQPSDVMKFALVLMMALYISKFQHKAKTFQYGLLCPACIVVLVCGTVALEKHMSATIILFTIGASMIFIAGADMKWVGGIAATFAAAATSLILFTDYTKKRVDAWLHPENDIGGSNWQPYQSLLAIGSGGLFGVGLGNSYQKHLWLPEPQNDFIFAIVCEELGMVGAFTLIALFMLLMWRGFVIAIKAPDTFSSMLVMGLTLKVSIQAILNIAVVTTTIPTTGIALPFFSYGGTALVMQLAEMGIILSISRFSSGEKNIFENKQRNYQPI
jgi:cell division protein FtsW